MQQNRETLERVVVALVGERGPPQEDKSNKVNSPRANKLPMARLAAEFLVIVTGVLVALGVDEFVAARAEADRAEAYLEQIDIELSALAAEVAVAIESFDGAVSGAVRLIEGMSSVPRAHSDSLDAWFSGLLQVGPYQPELVTLSTMIASGDLLLIRDQSLRSAMMRFESAPARLAATQGVGDQMLFDGFRVVGNLADVNVLAPLAFGTRPVAEQWDWVGLSSDVGFRSAIYSLGNGTRNHRDGLVEFSEEVAEVQEAVERYESTSR